MFNKQRILNVLAKVGLIFVGMLMAVALAEFAARLLGPPYEVGDGAHRSHQCDPVIGQIKLFIGMLPETGWLGKLLPRG